MGSSKAVSQLRPRALWLALVLLLSCVFPIEAAEIRLGGVIPGAGVIRKNMKSMRERRYLDMVPQETDFSCGAASVATILKYAYGRDMTERDVLEQMFEIADREVVLAKGFSLLDIKKYVEGLGMQGIGFRIAPENMDQIKMPTIALIDSRGYKHFVVVKKVRDERVYVADPALGNKIMKLEDFAAAWNGVVFAIVANNYNAENLLVHARDHDSARRLMGIRAPVVNAAPFDFGVTHADRFQF